jgi:hypothetical protein
MKTKIKIALHGLMQSVSRGILTEEQAKEEFKKITGRDPDEKPADDDEGAQSLGKFLDTFARSIQEGAAVLEAAEAEKEEDSGTVELNPPSDKLVKKRGKVVKDQPAE